MLWRKHLAKFIRIRGAVMFPNCAYATGLAVVELPKELKKYERKPWVTDINELKRKARREKQGRQDARENILRPPENGLLVKELVPVAQQVYDARAELRTCISAVERKIAIYTCGVCGEVHIGDPPHKIRTCNVSGSLATKEHNWKTGGVEHILPSNECFHLYDRIGRAVSHNERLLVDRISAVVELCVQAGVDIPEYPTRRRTVPVYSIAGKIVDFERKCPRHESPDPDINPSQFWEKRTRGKKIKSIDLQLDDVLGFAGRGMDAWEKIRSGAYKLMQDYAVQTCGYCSEIQVGPKGHRVRNCQAYKHQMRDGQHAWQEATVDDLIPPVYVWHIRDVKDGGPLLNSLKRYYGKLPAVVELFSQAGAQVGENYFGIMREDIAVPGPDEEKWAV